MLRVSILHISGGTCYLKSTPNDRFFEKLFMAILFTLRVFARNLLRENHRRNIFCILFWCLVRGSNPGFTSNKPIHYLLDHGDFRTLHLHTTNTTVVWHYLMPFFLFPNSLNKLHPRCLHTYKLRTTNTASCNTIFRVKLNNSLSVSINITVDLELCLKNLSAPYWPSAAVDGGAGNNVKPFFMFFCLFFFFFFW